MRKYFFIFISISLFLPAISSAVSCNGTENLLNLCYPTLGPTGSGITVGLGMDLNQLISWFYYFIVGISGFAAFVMLVWGGFDWLTSAGSPSKITEAKDKISSALVGLLLILASFLILQVINPELTTLNLQPLPSLTP